MTPGAFILIAALCWPARCSAEDWRDQELRRGRYRDAGEAASRQLAASNADIEWQLRRIAQAQEMRNAVDMGNSVCQECEECPPCITDSGRCRGIAVKNYPTLPKLRLSNGEISEYLIICPVLKKLNGD